MNSGGTAPRLIAVMGPTGAGKTALAERVAEQLNARLVSADAFQVYRGFDIGTAKPADPRRYALIDILEPHEPFGVGQYVQLACAELEDDFAAGRNVLLVGGTGFYVRALLEGFADLYPEPNPELREELVRRLETEGLQPLVRELQRLAPEAAAKVDLKNPVRVTRALEKAHSKAPPLQIALPPFEIIKLGLEPSPDILRYRIRTRIENMMQNGWAEEVRGLMARGVRLEDPAMRAIGYRTIWRLCCGELSFEAAVEVVANDTAQYAKRQRTWLRKEPRLERHAGFGDTEEAFEFALKQLKLS